MQIFRDYGATIAAAILIAVLLRSFVIEAYRIPSNAMKPTLVAGDMIFVEKWRYHFQKDYQPKRGDVVVYTGSSTAPGTNPDYIKRVVGLPGDEIEVQNGRVILNKQPLSPENPAVSYIGTETFPGGLNHPITIDPPLVENFGPQIIPEKTVFVLGDARTQFDLKSRKSWGMVPFSALKGKALSIWLSLQPDEARTVGKTLPTLRLERMFRRIE